MKNEIIPALHTSPAQPIPVAVATPLHVEPAQGVERKKAARSLVSQISEEQHLTLLIWLRDHSLAEVQRRVAAPPPVGFGLHTHFTTLQRIRTAQRAAPTVSAINELLDIITDIKSSADLDQLARIQRVISNLLHTHAFNLASKAPGSEGLPQIIRSIEKLSALEHKRQKLVLDREKRHGSPVPGPPTSSRRSHHLPIKGS
ncbi:MAG TPA: hypothetical protein VK633_13145 [Verrucomicrobiae bacterium]|nr:hypothetical protein [Verrucomicrobiae bacterium]